MLINIYIKQNKEKIQCYIPKYKCVNVYQVLLCWVWLAVDTYTAC